MPATFALGARSRESMPDVSSVLSLGQINTTGYLFGDDDAGSVQGDTTSPDVKSYLQLNATDDKFPVLLRGNNSGEVSPVLSFIRSVCGLQLSSAALCILHGLGSGCYREL
jgi:hypothetical protein